MSKRIVRNPLDERTCEYCLLQVGESLDDLIDHPPFEECENPDDDCRCFSVVEKEI